MGWAGHVARVWKRRVVYRVSVGKSEGKRPLGRHSRRWENNIKMDLEEVGYGSMGWIELDEDRERWRALVNAVVHVRVKFCVYYVHVLFQHTIGIAQLAKSFHHAHHRL
jgi:hypothetical protein